MKKKIGIIVLTVLVALFIAGCSTGPKEVSKFAGEYIITEHFEDGTVRVMDYFLVQDNGKIIGEVDDSGWSGFIGKINEEDGSFECYMTTSAIPGGFYCVIDDEGNITGTDDINGVPATITGVKVQ